MNVYEKSRQKLHDLYELELSELDKQRPNLKDSEYWDKYKKITDKYSYELREIDSQERTKESLILAKEQRKTVDRPESTYADVVGQLKAKKMRELITDLANISSSYRDEEDRKSVV